MVNNDLLKVAKAAITKNAINKYFLTKLREIKNKIINHIYHIIKSLY